MEHRSNRAKARRAPRTGGQSDSSFFQLLKESALGASASLLITAILLFLGAAICLAAADPNRLILPMGIVILLSSSFLGGLIASARSHTQALLHGLLCGGILFLVYLVLSLFLKNSSNGFSEGISLVLRFLTVALSILGAFLGVKKPDRRGRRRKK